MVDSFEQKAVVPYVIEADVRQARNRLLRFFNDALHVAVAVRHDHAESLIIFNLFRPDQTVGLRVTIDDGEIGIEQSVDKDDQQRPLDERPRQVDGAGRTILYLLLDEYGRHIEFRLHMRADHLLQVPRNEYELFYFEALEDVFHHIIEHCLARDLQQRFGDCMGVRA